MIAKTDAIVLKSMRFRETSKIVTFYTRIFGKLKAVAKGARETKTKFGAALEPMTLVSLVVYKKQGRDLQLVSQCDILNPYKKLHAEMERMSSGMAMVELLERVTHDEEENAPLFSLVDDCLSLLNESAGNIQAFLPAFEVRIASGFGFAPSLDACVSCERSLQTFDPKAFASFLVTQGSVVCPDCLQLSTNPRTHITQSMQSAQRLTVGTVNLLRIFQKEPMGSIPSIHYDEVIGNEIDETLRLYLRHHFEGLTPLKSTEVFQKLMMDVKGG
ncbi:MAG: DNA repair protein RecO [Ignavibacteriales bacterium]|nr:DNA repair protein RecO [Ignavibacteriales bacterium]